MKKIIKWINQSLERKAIFFLVIFFIITTIAVLQLIYYASSVGYMTSEQLRNSTLTEVALKELPEDELEEICRKAEAFYLSRDDIYREYQNDSDGLGKDMAAALSGDSYTAVADKSLLLTSDLAVDLIRLVVVDYRTGTYFTFLSSYFQDPENAAFVYRRTGIEPSPYDGPKDDTKIITENETEFGKVSSATYRLHIDDEHNIRTYLFLDSEHWFSKAVSGYSVRNAVHLMILIAVLVGALTLFLVHTFVITPLNSMAAASGKLLANLSDEENHARVFKDLNIHTGDELEHLYRSCHIMEEGIYTYMDQMRTVTAEKERISTELNIAKTIQSEMLPLAEPDFTNQQCYDLAASMRPAREIGGDFYDFFMLDEERLAFLIADVAGKGVPAALVMAIAKTMLKNYTKESGDIAKAFRILNNLLLDSNEESMFVTAFEGILNLRTGEMHYVNAGHESPFIMKKGELFKLWSEHHALVLGAMKDMTYKVKSITLEPGDRFYIYTDGVPEAHDQNNNMFGTDRTCSVLNEVKDRPAAEVIAKVRDEVDIFANEEPQFDDITMVCLDFRNYYKPE